MKRPWDLEALRFPLLIRSTDAPGLGWIDARKLRYPKANFDPPALGAGGRRGRSTASRPGSKKKALQIQQAVISVGICGSEIPLDKERSRSRQGRSEGRQARSLARAAARGGPYQSGPL